MFFELHLTRVCCKIAFYLLAQFLKATLNTQFHTMMTRYGNTHSLVVAYSGGLDSTVLLHLAAAWVKTQDNITLKAVHVHHGLHAHADNWAKHCEAVCAQHNIPVFIEHIYLTKQARRSLEEQARSALSGATKASLKMDGYSWRIIKMIKQNLFYSR